MITNEIYNCIFFRNQTGFTETKISKNDNGLLKYPFIKILFH